MARVTADVPHAPENADGDVEKGGNANRDSDCLAHRLVFRGAHGVLRPERACQHLWAHEDACRAQMHSQHSTATLPDPLQSDAGHETASAAQSAALARHGQRARRASGGGRAVISSRM